MIVNDIRELKRDPRVRLIAEDERIAINGGLQPYSMQTSSGTLLSQAQMPEKPLPSERICVYWRPASFVSRDKGVNWERVEQLREQLPGQNELYMEGGAVELSDGTFIQLDTFVTLGEPGFGKGLMLTSRDDLQSYEGPHEMNFELPGVNFIGDDDQGNPHHAIRLHRRVLEMPNGDVIALLHGWFHGDESASSDMPNINKTRCMLVRSSDQGRNWKFVSAITKTVGVGADGFCEPDLVRLSQGEGEGKLICYMRTGQELYWCESIDEGVTWSEPTPKQFGIVDVKDTESWKESFAKTLAAKPKGHNTELCGAFVDPNIIELKNGVLACTFGLRVPETMCWENPTHERNGNYVAFSLDQGATWSHIVQLTSGVQTTHYVAILEIEENVVQVMYCMGKWGDGYWDGSKGCYTAVRNLVLEVAS